MFSIAQARSLLTAADLFFGADEEEGSNWAQMLNLNDTFAWGAADAEYVSDEELPEVAELFWRYGNCGVLYWVSKKRDGQRSEFNHINRFIDFAANEERLRNEEPNPSKRAYAKVAYTLGDDK